ncbi:hypothetical protein [Thermus antranikianii]|uniref:Uncharacterized protein n=1 Tax=Thermus antranikianii TaxID=88190 RepID=A0ABY7RNH8_9DEIN|nr:hypothetical protein [Thermus antranikianii]WCM39137.1 hypothetical protein GO600_02905 [Thermus antranikianii]
MAMMWKLRPWQSFLFVALAFFGLINLFTLVLDKRVEAREAPGLLLQAFFFSFLYHATLSWVKKVGEWRALGVLSLVALIVVGLSFLVVLFYSRGY